MRFNTHGAIDLKTGRTVTKDALTVDDLSTILLMTAIEAILSRHTVDLRLSSPSY
jgi:hypothetical protein